MKNGVFWDVTGCYKSHTAQYPRRQQSSKNKLRSPQEKYTDSATATCLRHLVPTFVARGLSRGQLGGSLTVVNLSFLDRSRYFFFQIVPHLSSRGRVDPVPDPLLLRKSGGAGNRTRDLSL
jgi:hypothetical protein